MTPVNRTYNKNKNLSNSWVQLTQPIHTSINSFQIGMMHHQALEYVNPFTLTVGYQFFTPSSRLFFMATWEIGNRIYEKYAIYSFIKHHFVL